MNKGIIILLLLAIGYKSSGQTLTLSTGVVNSSTLWRMERENFARSNFGMNFFQIPKRDFSISLGLEYLEKEKWSMSSSILYYNSGGKLAVNERPESNPSFRWELDNNKYDIPTLSIHTNAYLELFEQKNSSLEAVLGVHLDYILKTENQELNLSYDANDPLGFMDRQEGLNRTNGGFNIGARYNIDFNKWKIGIQYIYAPRFLDLAHYDSEESDVPISSGISAFTVIEKVSFTQLTFGYKLKKKQL